MSRSTPEDTIAHLATAPGAGALAVVRLSGPDALTLAEVFQGAGYGTYAVQTNGWLHQSFGFHQGFDRYVFPSGRGAAGLPRASANSRMAGEE